MGFAELVEIVAKVVFGQLNHRGWVQEQGNSCVTTINRTLGEYWLVSYGLHIVSRTTGIVILVKVVNSREYRFIGSAFKSALSRLVASYFNSALFAIYVLFLMESLNERILGLTQID